MIYIYIYIYISKFRETIHCLLMLMFLQVEMKLKEATGNLERRLAEEQAARLRAEESAQLEQRKSNEEIRMLRERLEKAHEELRNKGGCAIL